MLNIWFNVPVCILCVKELYIMMTCKFLKFFCFFFIKIPVHSFFLAFTSQNYVTLYLHVIFGFALLIPFDHLEVHRILSFIHSISSYYLIHLFKKSLTLDCIFLENHQSIHSNFSLPFKSQTHPWNSPPRAYLSHFQISVYVVPYHFQPCLMKR